MKAIAKHCRGGRSLEEWNRFLREEAEFIGERHHAPGVAILSISRKRDIDCEQIRGFARVEEAAPLRLDTPIRAGSISKLATAIAVQQQVESGAVTLEKRIGEVLEWDPPFGYGEATLRELLTHKAGIGDRFARQSAARAEEIADLSGYLEKNLPPPVAGVGETITYSNFGISLAGLAIEKLSGRPFSDYARDKIFRPLGMHTATFIPPGETIREMAAGYNWVFGGLRKLPLRHWKPYPASSLVATPKELGLLMRSLLAERSPILARPATLFEEQDTVLKGVPGMGLGFWLDNIRGQRVAWHTGHMPGHRTGFYLFPDAGFGVILYYNTDKKVLRSFLEKVCSFAFPEPPRIKPGKVHPAASRDFRGYYRHSWYPHHHFGKCAALLGKEGEELSVKADGEGLRIAGERYLHVGKDIFLSRRGETRLGFIRNHRNRVTGLYAGGRDRYEKISPLEGSKAQMGFGVFCISLFAVCSALFLGNLLWNKPLMPSAAAALLLFMCTMNLSFMSAITALTALGAYKVTEEVPISVGITLSLPILGAGAGVLGLGILFFRGGAVWDFSPGGGIVLAAVAAELLFLQFLNYWKLLGWRY